MKNLFLSILIFFAANAKGQTLTSFTSTQQTQLKAYVKAAVDAQYKADTAYYNPIVRTLQKPNDFDTAFALVTKGATSNKIKGVTWKVDDLIAKVTALQNAGYITNNSLVTYDKNIVVPLSTRVKALEDRGSPSGADFTLLKQYIDSLRAALNNLPR